MFEILKKEILNDQVFSLEIHAPRVAAHALPGQFLIVKADDKAERIPLTIADYDAQKGSVCVVVQTIGFSTSKLQAYEKGDSLLDVLGPLGKPSEFVHQNLEQLKSQRIMFIGGGLGVAPIYPQLKWLHERGVCVEAIIGFRNKELIFWEEKLKAVCEHLHVSTDDGSYGRKGLVTDYLSYLVKEEQRHYDHVVVIGPMIMMKFVAQLTSQSGLNIPTTASMNPVMVDGTGMCGACRILVNGETKFACVDGPEFDAHSVDFDQALRRLRLSKSAEGRAQIEREEGEKLHEGQCLDEWLRVPIREQDAAVRAQNFDEVCYGYNFEEAQAEARRCFDCKKPHCVSKCPVSIDIPGFIKHITEGDLETSAQILWQSSSLPAVCGRVCPQEDQCEGVCIRGRKGEPVAIGKLERFVADWARQAGYTADAVAGAGAGMGAGVGAGVGAGANASTAENAAGDLAAASNALSAGTSASAASTDTKKQCAKTQRVAIVGSGPAGLSCAGDLAKLGYQVKIFESLHMAGGVLQYGIPEFRLPKDEVVAYEISQVTKLGVEIETDVFIGKSLTIKQLMEEEGFDAVFIASGAGLPRFMNIPGEHGNGVLSANEYLTKVNLMRAYDDSFDTKLPQASNVVVVGGGNVAMDAARTALRLGAKTSIVYRRSEEELPARQEEVHHAKEEGVIFKLLSNPVEILLDDEGWVSALKCVKMELGEPDESGRRRPHALEASDFVMACDLLILALGTNANPVALEGSEIETNPRGGIIIDDESGQTSMAGVFAGGDAVSGSATVILAMGAGKKAAAGIHRYLQEQAALIS